MTDKKPICTPEEANAFLGRLDTVAPTVASDHVPVAIATPVFAESSVVVEAGHATAGAPATVDSLPGITTSDTPLIDAVIQEGALTPETVALLDD